MDDKSYYSSLAELKVMTELTEKGWHVFNQVSGKAPFDIVIYKNGVLKRVSIKSCKKKAKNELGSYTIEVGRVRSNKTENKIHLFDESECDILAIYIVEIEKIFYLESKLAHGKKQLWLNTGKVAQVGL